MEPKEILLNKKSLRYFQETFVSRKNYGNYFHLKHRKSKILVLALMLAELFNCSNTYATSVTISDSDEKQMSDLLIADPNQKLSDIHFTGTTSPPTGTLSIDGNYTFTATPSTSDQQLYLSTNQKGILYLTADSNLTIANNTNLSRDGAIKTDAGARINIIGEAGSHLILKNNRMRDGGAVSAFNGIEFSGDNNLITFDTNASVASNGQGGAVYVNTGDLNFKGTNAIFKNNAAQSTTAGYGYGGAIFLNTGNILFDNQYVSFTDNQSQNFGGAIFINVGNITFNGDAIFNKNASSAGSGGAIAINQSGNIIFNGNEKVLTFVDNSSISSNASYGFGGAILLNDGNFFLNNTNSQITFLRNQASKSGAAIYSGQTINFSGNNNSVLFSNNSSSVSGGAIMVRYGLNFLGAENKIIFDSNTASTGTGGAVYSASYFNFSGIGSSLTITNNKANAVGGIYANGNIALDGNVIVAKNHSTGFQGGAIYGTRSFNLISSGASDSVFSDNLANSSGGAIYLSGAGATAADNTLDLYAQNSSISFSGNKSGVDFSGANPIGGIANAIHLNNINGTAVLNLASEAEQSISFYDPITSTMANGLVTVNINSNDNGVTVKEGTVLLTGENFNAGSNDVKSNIKARTTVYGGTFELKDNAEYGVTNLLDQAGTYFNLNLGSSLASTASTDAVSNVLTAESIRFKSGSSISLNGLNNQILQLNTNTATFEAGSNFSLGVRTDGTSDKINITGAAIIEGGAVVVLNPSALNIDKTYTILTTSTALTSSDRFSGVNDTLFLDMLLDYDSNNVYLKAKRNSTEFSDFAYTYNQRHTAEGINSLGSGNPIYNYIVASSEPQGLAAIYDNLSGEIHSSVKTAAIQNSRYVRDAMNHRLMKSSLSPNHDLWATTWHHRATLDTDHNAGELINKSTGILVGYDQIIRKDSRLGALIGYQWTDIDLKDRHSSATIKSTHLAIYGNTSAGKIDLRSGLGYSFQKADTSRKIWLTDLAGQSNGSYNGRLFQGFVEASRTFNKEEKFSYSPYVNLAYVNLATDDIKETGHLASLFGRKKHTAVAYGMIGVRGEYQASEKSKIFAGLAWQRAFHGHIPHTSMRFVGGESFDIKGTPLSKNSALINLGVDFDIRNNLKLTFEYQGEFGNTIRDHSGKFYLKYTF